MKKAALSDLKARLAKYIRLVKAGEQVEIQERGVPVALLSSILTRTRSPITPPRRDPKHLSTIQFTARTEGKVDIVKLLREDRDKR